MTGIEVLDTAVKIGLGALISGISTYVLAGRNAQIGQAATRLQRRTQLLESVAEGVQAYTQTFLLYWARVADAASARRSQEPLSTQAQEAVIAARESLFREAETLNAAEARLLLLGDTEASQLLRTLGTLAGEIRNKTSLKEPVPAEAELSEMRAELLRHRDAVFARLADLYQR